MNDQATTDTTPRQITVDIWKVALIFFTGIVGTAGASVWGTLALANTIPFRVEAIETEIDSIKQTMENDSAKFMPLDLSQEKWKNNDYQHGEIIRRLDVIQTTLGRMNQ